MTLNDLIQKIKNAEMKTLVKGAVIVVAGFWIVQEVMVFTLVREVAGTIAGFHSWLVKEQDTIEKQFRERWEKHFDDMNRHDRKHDT